MRRYHYQSLLSGIAVLTWALAIHLPARSAYSEEKEIVGWVEKVRLNPTGMVVQAKLDTGADFSSLSASEIKEFERDGAPWVSFSVENRYGEKKLIERKVHRTALIKRHGGKSPQKRPVIRLGLCLGMHYMEADVNLIDRSNFDFQMLIGRNFLAGNVLVDPASTYTVEPACQIRSKL